MTTEEVVAAKEREEETGRDKRQGSRCNGKRLRSSRSPPGSSSGERPPGRRRFRISSAWVMYVSQSIDRVHRDQ